MQRIPYNRKLLLLPLPDLLECNMQLKMQDRSDLAQGESQPARLHVTVQLDNLHKCE